MTNRRRVVVTGIGLVSSLGIGTEANWAGIKAGQSGIDTITKFDTTQFATRIAGEVKRFDPLAYIEKKDVKKMDIFIQYAIAASQFAMDDSGVSITPDLSRRVGVFIAAGIGGFGALRALSTRNDEPAKASRPFDRDRDGFIVGEGAGVLILEEYELARARGARIYAELVGYGMSADAYHITAPSEDGDGAFRVMSEAIQSAGISTTDVDYINAHGTSTPQGDALETLAINRCFGEHAREIAVSSTKSMTGHLLGAAGGLEAGITVLAVYHQVAPPTINLDHPDDNCNLDYVPHHSRSLPMTYALSNSFGFGGTNAALLFKRYEA